MRAGQLAEVVALDRGDALVPVAAADLVVLAAPVRANLQLLGEIRPLLGPTALVTDTSSTKVAILAAATGVRFIGGHPIAGAASGGQGAARADLFAGKPWVLSRGANTSSDDERRLEHFVERLGAVPHWMDAGEHDRLFAFVSHLPQLAISALMDVVGRSVADERIRLAGAGLRDSTRLAESGPDIWTDIVATNRPAIREALDALIATLISLRNDESGDALVRTFQHAVTARARLQDGS